jgi:hypothetical protein
MERISMKKILWMFLLMSICFNANADWGIIGIASKCDTAANVFELSPVVELSSENIAAIPVKSGFKQLPEGENKISCKLKTGSITGSIGNCMGAGYIRINSLYINNSTSVVDPQTFNWFCIGKEPKLVNVKVYLAEGKLAVQKCTANGWEWGKGLEEFKCEDQKLLP